MEEKIKALLENREFAAKAVQCGSVADAKALLAEYGVELTAEQIKTTGSEALSDNELESVAGGFFLLKWLKRQALISLDPSQIAKPYKNK